MKVFALAANETVGNPACPAMTRSVLAIGGFSIRLHRFFAGYRDVHSHSHPWWFATLVLRGGYVDHSDDGDDRLRAGSFRLRRPQHTHRLTVGQGGCLTLVLTGPLVNNWGFWVDRRFYPWNLYRDRFPAAPCAPTPVERGGVGPPTSRSGT